MVSLLFTDRRLVEGLIIMENESYGCRAASFINKGIDLLDRATYEMMFPQDLMQYSNGKLVNQERELPGWMKAISDFQKDRVNAALCPSADGTAKLMKAKTELPALEITNK